MMSTCSFSKAVRPQLMKRQLLSSTTIQVKVAWQNACFKNTRTRTGTGTGTGTKCAIASVRSLHQISTGRGDTATATATATCNANKYQYETKQIPLLGTTTTNSSRTWCRNTIIRHVSQSSSASFRITDVPDDVAKMIHKHASRPQTGVSLQTLMKTGRGEYLHKTYDDYEPMMSMSLSQQSHHPQTENSKLATDKILMQVAGFLRHELPIRLAHRILDLDRVPLMKEMDSVKQVRDLYVTSFLELLSVEKQVTSVEQEEAFARILESIYDRHASVLVQMARGAFELRAAIRKGSLPHKTVKQSMFQFDSMDDTHAFLDRFYISRIG